MDASPLATLRFGKASMSCIPINFLARLFAIEYSITTALQSRRSSRTRSGTWPHCSSQEARIGVSKCMTQTQSASVKEVIPVKQSFKDSGRSVHLREASKLVASILHISDQSQFYLLRCETV